MFKRLACLTLVLAGPSPAFAHFDPIAHGSFLSGFSHPLSGIDHVAVMVAIGVWAARCGGRALWLSPGSFLTFMTVGYLLSLSGIVLPFVEPLILASLVALVALTAMPTQLPILLGAIVVGGFALFHGYAHGGELGAAGALPFGIGFLIATALLHAVGVGLGLLLGFGADSARARPNSCLACLAESSPRGGPDT